MSASLRWLAMLALAFTLFALASSQPAFARLDPVSDDPVIASEVPDAPLPLDHFYCYDVQQTPPVNQTVQLQDQFDANPVDAVVGLALRLCNPAKKIHGDKIFKIQHPNDHLVWYQIGVPVAPPQLKVRVKNQFGEAILKVFMPAAALAVPSQKFPHDPPKDTDHFKCYRVKGDAINVQVGLRDQFQKNGVMVYRPIFLCNPTMKVHNAIVTNVMHPEAHLVCYNVTKKEFSKLVQTQNQFRAEDITTIVANLLCVPSRKSIIQ